MVDAAGDEMRAATDKYVAKAKEILPGLPSGKNLSDVVSLVLEGGDTTPVLSTSRLIEDYPESEVLIVCVPVGYDHRPMPGGSKSACSDCQEPIWVSPQTLEKLPKLPNALTVCPVCADKRSVPVSNKD